MHLLRHACVLLVAIGGMLSVSVAGAAPEISRPSGSPDLAAMSLAVFDLPAGTTIESQGYVRDRDFVATYEREFDVRGGRVGRSRLLGIFESLSVDRNATDARLAFEVASALLRGKNAKQFIEQAIAEGAGRNVRTSVGRIRRPKIGHGAVTIPVRMTISGLTFDATVVLLRFDRALASVTMLSMPFTKLNPADTDRIARVAATRIKAGLVPALSAAPTHSGLAQPAQVLTAARGTWKGDQLQFTYQWERCDAAGAACAAIPGASGQTYTVTTGDLASTLRVSVRASNRLGSVRSSSTVTTVVVGPAGSPLSTAAPVISGTVAVGQTLTTDAGSWSGSPMTSAYQWRRCDAAGGACVDIAGANATSYVVSGTDSRSTLRVLVVASNAVGPGGAISAATAAVP